MNYLNFILNLIKTVTIMMMNNNDYLRYLYVKFIRNIKNIKNGNFNKFKYIDNGQNIEHSCIYLKYWIYDIISNHVTQDNDISTFFDAWDSKKRSLFPDNNCPCEFYKMKLNDIKYMRKLYTYYMLFDIYKKNNISGDFDKNGIYCYYLNQFIHMYDKKKDRCSRSNSENVCNEFNKYIKDKVDDTLYDIFQLLHSFENPPKKKSETISIEKYISVCQNIECEDGDCTNNFKSNCENFLKMLLHINNYDNDTLKVNYKKYLDYWIYDKLNESRISEKNRNKFYTQFNQRCSNINELKTLDYKISDINVDEYKKMNILYNLYYNYNNIEKENTEDLSTSEMKSSQYATICFNKFKEGIEMYKSKEDKEFYDALNEFRGFYKNAMYRKKLYKKIDLKSLPELKSLNDLNKENPQISTNSPCKNINNNVLINIPRRKNEYDILLKGITEDDIYKIFSENSVDENICAEHCKNLISIDSNNEKIKALCATLATNIKNLNTITNVGSDHKEKCSNLMYWTYDQIMNIFGTTEKYYKSSSFINEINKVISRVNDELKVNENCYFYVDGDFDQWIKERDLHDYFADFENLNNTAPGDSNKNSNYCRYFKYIYDLYKENVKKCCARYIRPEKYMVNNCPNYFKCEEKYYPIDLMTKFKCENNEYKESVKDIFDSITVDLNVIRYSIFMNSFNQIINITNDPFYLFVLAAFGLLGFFFIFFIFYKVTRHTIYIYAHILYVNYIVYFLKTFRIMKYMYYK
ncbi:hypothetical protein PVIIG_00407 [Plasmodium vivax India VII]|uniref:Uncharacterized protein n=1 Tax=Plasmodium vivax India VII TaxID=1077284 RepID=A0A0J9S7V8_PLAVI|nr:hypothetical protein PVIIG_00407 [Plasmodium vivax India VII]